MTNTAPQNNSISTYNQYKDTGIPWLGQIPAHWEVRKLKYLGQLYAGLSGKNGNDFSKIPKRNFKPFITFTSIYQNDVIHSDENKFEYVKIEKFEQQNKVSYNDILFLMSSETIEDIGKGALYKGTNIEIYLNSFCKGFRIKNNNIIPEFLNFLVNSNSFRNHFMIYARGFTRINLKQEYVNNMPILIPPKPEQTAIARFLDRKTTQIDQAIAQKQALINRLKTYKQVLIQQAVTKGLNPDAPLKDSGVEWIGQIPAHWEVMRLKYLISFHKGKVPSVFYNEEKVNTLPYLSMEYLREENGKTQWVKNNGIKANYGDILLLWDGSNAGEFIKSKEGIVSSTLALLSFNEKYLVNNYTWYLVKIIEKELRKGTVGMGIPHVNGDKLKNLQVFLPPKPEQTAIANFLDRKTTQIDHTIALQEKEIKRLQTYKTVLIDQAVTGKIKVI